MLNNEFQISSVTTTYPLYCNSVVLSYIIINMHTSMYIISFALTEAAMIKKDDKTMAYFRHVGQLFRKHALEFLDCESVSISR